MRQLRIFFVAMVVALVSLSSCSKDNDTSNNNPTQRDRARYTIMVYGNAGGQMDFIVENMWDELKPMLDDSTDVRMVFLYKYGAESETFSGRYGDPGNVVWFELDSETSLDSLRHSEGVIQAPGFPLYEPYMVANYIKIVKENCPADNYIFILWGHGGGYDIVYDRPNNMVASNAKGVLYDELDEGRGMSMYEFADGLATAGNTHFQLIMFHNCLMGNIENVTEVQQYADYFFTSSHVLDSDGRPIVELVKVLRGNDDCDFERTARLWFDNLCPLYDRLAAGSAQNQDFKILRASGFENLNISIMHLAKRLVQLYSDPAYKAQIDSAAANRLYHYNNPRLYLVDLDLYARNLIQHVDDSLVRSYAARVRTYLDEMIVRRWHYTSPNGGLDDYSLSIVFGHHDFLHTAIRGNTVASAYYPSVFNRRTGWVNWLNTNTFWPSTGQYPDGTVALIPWENYLEFLQQKYQ